MWRVFLFHVAGELPHIEPLSFRNVFGTSLAGPGDAILLNWSRSRLTTTVSGSCVKYVTFVPPCDNNLPVFVGSCTMMPLNGVFSSRCRITVYGSRSGAGVCHVEYVQLRGWS